MSADTIRSVKVDYPRTSEVALAPDGARLLLALDRSRGDVGLSGRVAAPARALVRDALLTALAVQGSDLRYKRRDRTAYLAYLAKKGKKATQEIWDAHKQFLDETFGDEAQAASPLDPVLTVHPDELSLEVFSRDESSYARLSLGSALFEERAAAHGTAFVTLPGSLAENLERVPSYGPFALDVGTRIGGSAGPGEQRTLDLPRSWLRGFVQVQSAATLPAAECELAPIDLYNVLYVLRMKRAKTPPRALRFELLPGARPRLILEPWEILLRTHGPVYPGRVPAVVRTFGRQRLMALARLLPHARRVRMRLGGPGLPLFCVVELAHASFTLGLTGWTESGWSSAGAFDLLMPVATPEAGRLADKLTRILAEHGPQTQAELMHRSAARAEDLHAALQLECLRGRVLHDLAEDRYRPRLLFAEPIDEAAIRYGSGREQRAHRLLGESGEVAITKLHEIAGEGVEIHGTITDREAHRSFTPHFLVDLEGRVKDAACGCPSFRRAGLREGPCEHMIALRLTHLRRRAHDEALRRTPEGRKLIRAETRTYVRRAASGDELVYRVTLDDRVVRLEWGARTESPRQQRLWFDSDHEARDAYFQRLDGLAADGFIDADAAVT